MMFHSIGEFRLILHRNYIHWWTQTLRFQSYVVQKCKKAALTLDLFRDGNALRVQRHGRC